ncbi:MAG: hypothetical protein OXH23_12775 [bacterium]|nr:hypothetical protein [bacterium]
MALDFGQRRALWAVLAVFVGLAILFVQVRGCKSGQRLAGKAKGSVESIEQVPLEYILELPGLEEYLSSTEPPMALGKFVHLGCALIIDDDAQHLIYTDDPDCPSVVLPDAAGFDLVISYTDASCRWEPTFEVNRTEGLLHFTINKTRDRGGCEDMRIPLAKGVQIKEQASGPG